MHQPGVPSSQPGLSNRVNDSVVWTSVSSTVAMANATATISRPAVLARLLSPRLRSSRDLDPVVEQPDGRRATDAAP